MNAPDGQSARILVCDIGLTQVKVTVFEQDGRVAASRELDNRAVIARGTHSEMDLDRLWDILCGAMRELAAGMDGISAIGLSACGNGLYLVGGDGAQLCAITSIDQRSRSLVAQWRADGLADEVFARTGNHAWPGQPLPLLAYLRDRGELPETGTLLFCKDWLRFRLTGEFATERSDASAAGLLDLSSGDWAFTLLEGLGLSAAQLPELAESTAITGHLRADAARLTGLPPGIPVFGGGIDLALGAWADGLEAGTLHVTAGTWSINQFPAPSSGGDASEFLQTILPPQGDAPVWVDSSPSSGINIDFLRTVAGDGREEVAAWGALLDGFLPETETPIYLPYPAGTWDLPGASAGVLQIQPGMPREAFIQTVFEGIALGHVRQIRKFQRQSTVRRIVACGGLTRCTAWCQLLADYSGLPVEVVANPHSSSLGAALCCLQGLGIPLPEPKAARTVLSPQPGRTGHQRLERFLQLLNAYEPGT